MSLFWVGFLTGVWICPFVVILALFFYAQWSRWN